MTNLVFVLRVVSIDDLPALTNLLTLVMILLAIAGFTALWLYVFWVVWTTEKPDPPTFNDAIQYLAPILTALVGGIVAMVFGVSIAHPPQSFFQVAAILLSFKPATWVFGVYIVDYLVLGALAAITWVARMSKTPPLVRNFAMTTVGLVVAVVSASFGLKT
jgi:hypothetical protein